MPPALVLKMAWQDDRCRFEVVESHGVHWMRCPPRHERYKNMFNLQADIKDKQVTDDIVAGNNDSVRPRGDGALGSSADGVADRSADVVADRVEVVEVAPAVAGVAPKPPWRLPQPPPATVVSAAELDMMKNHRAEVMRGRISVPALSRLPDGYSPEGQ